MGTIKKRTVYDVVPRGGGWGCKVSGKFIVVINSATLCDKETYVAAVKRLARENWVSYQIPSEVIIHNRDGKIGAGPNSRVTYGRDPRKSKG